MSEDKHKTTWEVKHCPRGGEPSYDIDITDGSIYTTVGSVWTEAQADLIVLSVNSHAPLVGMLKELVAKLRERDGVCMFCGADTPPCHYGDCFIRQVENEIEAAEGNKT